MATEKERELMREIMDLALDVNDQQDDLRFSVDIRNHGFELRIHKVETDGWVFYPGSPAYFSDEIFTEEGYEEKCKMFMEELLKHHKDYDADGIRMEVAK